MTDKTKKGKKAAKKASLTKKEFEAALDQYEVAEPEMLDSKMDFVLSQAKAEDPVYADSTFEQGVQPPAFFNMTFFTLRRMALPVMMITLLVMGAFIMMRGGVTLDAQDAPVQIAAQQDIEPTVYNDGGFETHVVAFETEEVLSDTIDQDIILLEMAMLDLPVDDAGNSAPEQDGADDAAPTDDIEDFLDELFGPETSQL